jgi:hypothetical protein
MKNALWFVLTVIAPPAAFAQGAQNVDFTFLGGPAWVRSQTLRSPDATVSGALGGTFQALEWGYQMKQTKVGALWLEVLPQTSVFLASSTVIPAKSAPGITGSGSFGGLYFAPGVRFMIPLKSRFSLYGALGGGAAFLSYPGLDSTKTVPTVTTQSTIHGVVAFGGGVDYRLSERLSLRADLRQYISGSGLNHLLPTVGISFHY